MELINIVYSSMLIIGGLFAVAFITSYIIYRVKNHSGSSREGFQYVESRYANNPVSSYTSSNYSFSESNNSDNERTTQNYARTQYYEIEPYRYSSETGRDFQTAGYDTRLDQTKYGFYPGRKFQAERFQRVYL